MRIVLLVLLCFVLAGCGGRGEFPEASPTPSPIPCKEGFLFPIPCHIQTPRQINYWLDMERARMWPDYTLRPEQFYGCWRGDHKTYAMFNAYVAHAKLGLPSYVVKVWGREFFTHIFYGHAEFTTYLAYSELPNNRIAVYDARFWMGEWNSMTEYLEARYVYYEVRWTREIMSYLGGN